MIDAVEWTGIGVLAGIVLGGVAYLSHQLNRGVDRLCDELVPRLDRIDERFARHLEMHARH